jgi:hypothetical protein
VANRPTERTLSLYERLRDRPGIDTAGGGRVRSRHVAAIASYARLKEPRDVALTTVILLIAVFVSIGRFGELS